MSPPEGRVQGLIGCYDHIPEGLFFGDELDGAAVEIGYDCAGLLCYINSREYINEGLPASEVAVYFAFGDINKAIGSAVGIDKFEWF